MSQAPLSTDLQLTREVPRHTVTQRFTWLQREFIVMSDDYRAIRAKLSRPMDTCDWCKHSFANGEQMALAGRPKGRNWLLCQSCVAKAGPHV